MDSAQQSQHIRQVAVVAHRIVLESIGTGGFAHLGVLRQVRPGSDSKLAELMVQAPSELALMEDADDAVIVSNMLNKCVLDCVVQSADDDFVKVLGEFDVAVFLDDFGRAGETVAEVGRLLGDDPARARDLICHSPPALLGNVSGAMVEALKQRISPLGASVVSSRRSDARYDICEHGRCRLRIHLRLFGRTGNHGNDQDRTNSSLRQRLRQTSPSSLSISASASTRPASMNSPIWTHWGQSERRP